MGLAKRGFILLLIFFLSQGRTVEKKLRKKKSEKLLKDSMWHRFACRTDSNCPNSKYCVGWKCVLRHEGFCSNDSECLAHEWCNIKHQCVQKSWCDTDADCGVEKCCARIDPIAQGSCLPFVQPGQLCLIETVLCPWVMGYHCKSFSKRLGRCAKKRDAD